MVLAAKGADPDEAYKALILADIQLACDLFAETYQKGGGPGLS